MREQQPDISDRTNNFHAYFERELLSPEKLDGHLFFSVVGGYIVQLEAQNGLWSRFRQEQAELFQEILNSLRKTHEEFDPDHDKWMELMRAHRFDEAERFEQKRRLFERQKEINAELNPLLNKAFDLLVSWDADPKKLAR